MLSFLGFDISKSLLKLLGMLLFAISILLLAFIWRSDIQKMVRSEIQNDLSEDRIETLDKGRKIDEKIFNSDRNDLCRSIGGC